MSFFPHGNQNFEEGFDRMDRPPMRGPPVPMRGPPIDQDINSRRFDPRSFPEHRGLDLRQSNGPDFGRGMHPPGPGRGLEPPHRPNDMRFEPPRPMLDGRPNELRTYDRQIPPPGPPPRVDPRINFPVGLPPPAMNAGGPLAPPPGPGGPQPSFRGGIPDPLSQSPHLHHQPPHASPPLGLGGGGPFGGGGPSLLAPFSRPQSVTEIVPVHVDLATFASEPKFQQILLKVKEQAGVNYISLNRIADDLVESIVIDAPTKDAANLARNLIETHLKLQLKIKAAENRLQRVQTDLFSTQGEIAAGQMVEFMIQPELIGLAIGKKGARIRQIEKDTGVSSINVSDNGHIMIYGPDSQSVQRAREQLELVEESFPLNNAQMEWMSDKLNASVLNDLKNGSGVMLGKVNRETCKLDVVGTNPSVQTAKFLLATQLEYIDKQIEIEANEREAREKLNAVRKQYGLNTPQWKSRAANNNNNNNKTGGDRSRSPDDLGRRVSEETARRVSDLPPTGNNTNRMNDLGGRGNDVVDSLVRASMKDNIPAKSSSKLPPPQPSFTSYADKDRDFGYSSSKIESQLEKLVLSVEDELDALISETPANKKQNDSKNKQQQLQRPAKELVLQDTFLGANIKDIKDTSSEKGGDNKGGKRDRDRRDNRDKGGNNNNNNRNANNNNNESANKSKGNNNNNINNSKGNRGDNNNNNKNKQDNKGSQEKGSKNKEKTPALKLVTEAIAHGSTPPPPDHAGLLVIPPAPVLVVPPPPSAAGTTGVKEKDNQKNNNKGKKGRKAELVKDESAAGVMETDHKDRNVVVVEEKKSVKESMLIRLNNPFLEQSKGKKLEEIIASNAGRVVSLVSSDTGTSDSSPKKQDVMEGKKNNRGNNNKADQTTPATATAATVVKGDSVDTPVEESQGKAKRRRNKNKNKNTADRAGDSASPTNTPKEPSSLTASLEAFKVISVTDLEKHPRLDDFEPPLPRPVKKGPPAIPNKIVVVEPETEKKVSPKAEAKPDTKSEPVKAEVPKTEGPVAAKEGTASATATSAATKEPSPKSESSPAATKKTASPPGLVAPPGLNKSVTTAPPAAPATYANIASTGEKAGASSSTPKEKDSSAAVVTTATATTTATESKTTTSSTAAVSSPAPAPKPAATPAATTSAPPATTSTAAVSTAAPVSNSGGGGDGGSGNTEKKD